MWAGISYKGRTNICIFTGIMDSVIYQKILEDNFLPFVRQKFPDGRYRLYQVRVKIHVYQKHFHSVCRPLVETVSQFHQAVKSAVSNVHGYIC